MAFLFLPSPFSIDGFARVTRTHEMSLTIKGIYCDNLKSVVQLTQQWTAVDGKSKNVVVAKFQEASCFSWFSVEVGSNRWQVRINSQK